MNGIRFICFFVLLCAFTASAPLYADSTKKEARQQKKLLRKKALVKAREQADGKQEDGSPKGQFVNGVQLPSFPPFLDEDQLKITQKLPDFSPLIDAIKDLHKINKSIQKKSAPSKVLQEQRKKTVVRIFQIGKRLRENYDGQLKNLEKQEKNCQNKINQETNDRMVEKFQAELQKIQDARERPQLIIDVINHYLFEALEEPFQEDDSETKPE